MTTEFAFPVSRISLVAMGARNITCSASVLLIGGKLGAAFTPGVGGLGTGLNQTLPGARSASLTGGVE